MQFYHTLQNVYRLITYDKCTRCNTCQIVRTHPCQNVAQCRGRFKILERGWTQVFPLIKEAPDCLSVKEGIVWNPTSVEGGKVLPPSEDMKCKTARRTETGGFLVNIRDVSSSNCNQQKITKCSQTLQSHPEYQAMGHSSSCILDFHPNPVWIFRV